MKTNLLILIFLLVATSCSPTHRLNRLLAHHPELKTPDTLYIKDTIPIPQAEADTILSIDSIHDTIYIRKDRLEIRMKRMHDTLYVQGKCLADTVIIMRKVPVEKIKYLQRNIIDRLINGLPWIIIGVSVILILYLCLRTWPRY